VGDGAQAEGRRHRVMDRVRERRRRHAVRGRVYRVTFAAVGFILVGLGMILALPLVPGPGVLLVIVGLAMLAHEFDWAERLLERTLDRAERAAARAASRSGLGKTAGPVALVLVVGIALVAVVLWGVPFVGS
jgi:uncharacterized protein (TIGR02611 family)